MNLFRIIKSAASSLISNIIDMFSYIWSLFGSRQQSSFPFPTQGRQPGVTAEADDRKIHAVTFTRNVTSQFDRAFNHSIGPRQKTLRIATSKIANWQHCELLNIININLRARWSPSVKWIEPISQPSTLATPNNTAQIAIALNDKHIKLNAISTEDHDNWLYHYSDDSEPATRDLDAQIIVNSTLLLAFTYAFANAQQKLVSSVEDPRSALNPEKAQLIASIKSSDVVKNIEKRKKSDWRLLVELSLVSQGFVEGYYTKRFSNTKNSVVSDDNTVLSLVTSYFSQFSDNNLSSLDVETVKTFQQWAQEDDHPLQGTANEILFWRDQIKSLRVHVKMSHNCGEHIAKSWSFSPFSLQSALVHSSRESNLITLSKASDGDFTTWYQVLTNYYESMQKTSSSTQPSSTERMKALYDLLNSIFTSCPNQESYLSALYAKSHHSGLSPIKSETGTSSPYSPKTAIPPGSTLANFFSGRSLFGKVSNTQTTPPRQTDLKTEPSNTPDSLRLR